MLKTESLALQGREGGQKNIAENLIASLIEQYKIMCGIL